MADPRAAFMRRALRVILARPDHPLGFLVDRSQRKWVARRHLDDAPGVQAGHLESRHGGAPERLAIQDASDNQLANWVGESKGAIFENGAVSIGGIPVEAETAKLWERLGEFPAGTVASSASSRGWQLGDTLTDDTGAGAAATAEGQDDWPTEIGQAFEDAADNGVFGPLLWSPHSVSGQVLAAAAEAVEGVTGAAALWATASAGVAGALASIDFEDETDESDDGEGGDDFDGEGDARGLAPDSPSTPDDDDDDDSFEDDEDDQEDDPDEDDDDPGSHGDDPDGTDPDDHGNDPADQRGTADASDTQGDEDGSGDQGFGADDQRDTLDPQGSDAPDVDATFISNGDGDLDVNGDGPMCMDADESEGPGCYESEFDPSGPECSDLSEDVSSFESDQSFESGSSDVQGYSDTSCDFSSGTSGDSGGSDSYGGGSDATADVSASDGGGF
jgi:hypothetical protein